MGSLVAIHPDGTAVSMPPITVRVGTERYRFVPGQAQLVYIRTISQVDREELWMLDFSTNKTRQLGNFDSRLTRTFDIPPDGKHIVFDRVRENSDIVLIDLPQNN
jgi:hypothetical protein